MRRLAASALALLLPMAVIRPEGSAADVLAARVDALLAAAWKAEGIEPAPPADDATWLRRLSLDVRGVIPTAEECASFLADRSADKRERTIDAWLDGPDFARHLSYRWSNVLFATAPRERQRCEALLRPWLEAQFAAKAPFSAIVEGVVAGSEWTQYPAAASYVMTYQDSIETLAGGVARSFLGLQIQCAQCHDHPFDTWKQVEFNRFAAFFIDLRSDHVAGPNHTSVFRVIDRNPEWDFQDRLNKMVVQARRPSAGMSGGMQPERTPKAEGDAVVFEDDLTGADAGMEGVMAARAQANADQLAAMEELLAVAKKTKKREDVLRDYASDAERMAGLLARLPSDARDLITRYRERRAAFTDAAFLDGTAYADEEKRTRRAALAEWITRPDNPWYGRTIANRVVAELFGHGAIEPIDDLSGSKDRIVPELLDEIAAAFTKGNDVRVLYRALCRTRAYAAGHAPLEAGPLGAKAERWLAAQPMRSFTAEQLLFSLARVTSPDGDCRLGPAESDFLVERDRKARIDKLKAWCSGDAPTGSAEYEPSIPAALYLMNGDTTARSAVLQQVPAIAPLFEAGAPLDAPLDALFLRTLSRLPTAAERERCARYLTDGDTGRLHAIEDLFWSLLNATEFHTRS